MSASFDHVKMDVVVQDVDGNMVSFDGVKVNETKIYKEYHKREVFLLNFLFDKVWLFSNPEQFEIFEFTLPSRNELFYFPYRINFRNEGKVFFLWVILVANKEGRLSIFAISMVQEINSPDGVWRYLENGINNPNLIWEKD